MACGGFGDRIVADIHTSYLRTDPSVLYPALTVSGKQQEQGIQVE